MNIFQSDIQGKLIPFMFRQARHERNQPQSVRPEPVEGHSLRLPHFVATKIIGKGLFNEYS